MSLLYRISIFFILICSVQLYAQHKNKLVVDVDVENKILRVKQEIVYNNQTKDTLKSFFFNDWNNAYSGKNTPLAKRFSDEYVRAYHLAKDNERGSTKIYSIIDQNSLSLTWRYSEKHPDIVNVSLKNPIYPNQKFKITITYDVKIPKDRFTKFGYNDNGDFNLKNWFLSPPQIENNHFVQYSNENLDDIANAVTNFELKLNVPQDIKVTSDLNLENKSDRTRKTEYLLTGKNRTDFSLILEKNNSYQIYKNDIVEVYSNLKDNRITDVEKALLINKIVNFTSENIGGYPYEKIVVSQVDYDRNPFYGLNQLPSFLRPFPDSFVYEIKFLKTYLNNYLKNTLNLDLRKDNWIYDGIQMYVMMKYIDENHPDKKMMGSLSDWGILKGHNLFDIDFNEQYNYFYLLMARKNLDQPIGNPKNSFIKFQEQISGKYKAGLSLNYLDSYLGNNIVHNSIKEFYSLNTQKKTNRLDFENILKSKTDKNIDWFFNTIIDSRELIDYKFGGVKKQKDSLKITLKNKTNTNVPVSLYGIKKDTVVFKKWIENVTTDSTFTITNSGVEKLALNYNDEIPEYNKRNNWKNLNGIFNKPIKFTLFQDIENPDYNQIFYVPSFIFNLYDGVSPGLRFHNKSLLDKPYIFDINPTYSSQTNSLIGSFSFAVNTNIRDESLYNIRYAISGSTFHYAPDAAYQKFTPSIQFRFREEDYRKNKRQYILLRQVVVNREKSNFIATDTKNENYSIFNARYIKSESEILRHYNFSTDIQIANSFGKLSGEIEYRKLFEDNRQINIRLFAGTFMYRSTSSEFFSFGLDRPTDYLFDYNFYGRSETTGLYSQQYVMAEGGFKSKLDIRYANQWMTTLNTSFNIWNWIEVYGDAGFFKNKFNSQKFVYDSGIRLNLVTGYFELYLPVFSSNGFELNDAHYNEKIRFVVTLSPGTLINLFTRKWL